MNPPSTTTIAQIGSTRGTSRTLDTLPRRPETELTRMNAAARLALSRMSAHRVKTSNGLRKMPPPVPVNPERNPIAPPLATAGTTGRSCS